VLEGLGVLSERSCGGDEVRGPDGAPAEQAGRFGVVLGQVGGTALDADLVVLHDGQRDGDLPGRDADHHDRSALVGDGYRLVDGGLDGLREFRSRLKRRVNLGQEILRA